MKLSIIIPSYNEEGNVEEIYKRINEIFKNINYEIIYVDDGSKDDTYKVLKGIYNKDKKHVRVINFSRNFGKDAAIYAGLSHAKGEYISIIDADMEQDPKYLLEMVEFLDNNEDYDQVAMVIKARKSGSFIKKRFSKLFYKVINKLSDVKFIEDASDFRMFRSYVKDAILALPEKNRFSKGIFNWIGFNTKIMEYDVGKRLSGESKFNTKISIKYALEGIISYSTKPLRLATILGLLTSLAGFIYLIYVIIKTIVVGIDSPGFATIVCLILFVGGIQLICIGILGEYMSKTFIESKNRPVYLSRVNLGIDDDKDLL